MKTENYLRKINAALVADYNHETPDKLRSQEFNKLIKKMLKEMFPEAEVIPTKGAWCEASGFLKFNESCIYYRFQDYRYNAWNQRILIRTAENEKDYRGGGNHYTDLDKMRDDVLWLARTKR